MVKCFLKYMLHSLEKRSWWNYIHHDIKELLKEAVLLLTRVKDWKENFHDYAFIVFPAAKAYEGFLKTIFHDLGFITDEDYLGKRFRIGKALNPNLEPQYREMESVYDKLVDYCRNRELADKLWETWKNGRNVIFHWFPNEKNAIDYREARDLFEGILDAMDFAYRECRIKGEIKKPVS